MTHTAGIDATLSEVVRTHERRGSAGDAHYGPAEFDDVAGLGQVDEGWGRR
jgi:hypothetical protein